MTGMASQPHITRSQKREQSTTIKSTQKTHIARHGDDRVSLVVGIFAYVIMVKAAIVSYHIIFIYYPS